MREPGRWTTVTPSQYEHERKALKHVQEHLPDQEPFRAWSNFTFTAETGHVYEVDLLVAAPSGLYLIEIKSFNGRVTASGPNWMHNGRALDNPLHLANTKAQKLKSLLVQENRNRRTGLQVPFLQAAVFLSEPGLRVELPQNQMHWLFGPERSGGARSDALPSVISDLLLPLPASGRGSVDARFSRALPGLLEGVGIARSKKHFQIGMWDLEPKPFDIGKEWQDHLARHRELSKERRRIRIYLVERNAAQADRASVERAARREMQVLHGISHPGIVQPDSMEAHENGPALIFRHPREAMRLDRYMAEFGPRLDVETRVGMVRQLAEAMAYAHRRRLFHRMLAARSILVAPGPRRVPAPGQSAAVTAEQALAEAWLRPHLLISDWQAAVRSADSYGSSGSLPTPSSHTGRHTDAAAEPYLAPELSAPNPDSVAMDMFGLGSVSYFLVSGKAPADTHAELLARVSQDNGLRPSAVAEAVTPWMDELIQAATAPVPNQRLSSVAEFLELLTEVEDDLTAPTVAEAPAEEELDPLEARPGDVVGGEWKISKRLGTGSTCRAFLAVNERTGAQEVLKVALSDEKAKRLEHEARVLSAFPADSRVIRLARREPQVIGSRAVLVLEHAGEHTVARKLREGGRLEPGELQTFSEYLFGALDFLEGEGIFHRDIKPDNIAIRVRKNRTKQLVLFDFSLAGIDVRETEAGTPRYLDPFIGTVRRPVYDAHAERYALAITLHEMASNELPLWGDGATEATLVDEPVTLAIEAFDPSLRESGLVDFFARALAKDANDRFASLQEMHAAWRRIFDAADATRPVGAAPRLTGLEADDDDPQLAEQERDDAAAKAGPDTLLVAAGLTARAISAAERLEVTKVADLLPLAGRITSLPGLGAKTRKELQTRIKEWRTRFGSGSSPTSREQRRAAERELAAAEESASAAPSVSDTDDNAPDTSVSALDRIGLDSIAALLVPAMQKTRRNENEVEATRLMLRLPDADGNLPDLPPWPPQQPVGALLRITTGRVGQVLVKQRQHWAQMPVMHSILAELVELLEGFGRIAGAQELADALLARRGSSEGSDAVRRAIAAAVVRAAVEADSAAAEDRRFLTRRTGDQILIALEAPEDATPDTPAPAALIKYALKLGETADRLADMDVMPTSASVLRELTIIRPRAYNVPTDFEHARLVHLAAAAASQAAASPRLEIYPRDLAPERALRLAQAGVAPPAREGSTIPGSRPNVLRPEQVQERVQARFPELAPLPGHPQLHKLLNDAGFDLEWQGSGRQGGYVTPRGAGSSTGAVIQPRKATDDITSQWHTESPELARAVRAEQQLAGSRDRDGFRALTVSMSGYLAARDELVRRFDVRPVDVGALFVATMRELVSQGTKPTWETVVEADIAEPGSLPHSRLHSRFIDPAWEHLQPQLEEITSTATGPVLLHGASPLARYDRMQLPLELGGTVWLLCPMRDATAEPMLDHAHVPLETKEQWIVLNDAWVANQHRTTTNEETGK
ncbi:BREX system serine/threonine kinase PglW [Streptomyces sp. NPDC048560]|uniref:BREX system serine/threonine kinase PglW n=1 Tax=Streptomyces sp. NPDC048560 TaxID=3155488 RepID=UPI00341B6418